MTEIDLSRLPDIDSPRAAARLFQEGMRHGFLIVADMLDEAGPVVLALKQTAPDALKSMAIGVRNAAEKLGGVPQ